MIRVSPGPADALFSSPDGIAFSSILKKAGQDVSADKKLHEVRYRRCFLYPPFFLVSLASFQ